MGDLLLHLFFFIAFFEHLVDTLLLLGYRMNKQFNFFMLFKYVIYDEHMFLAHLIYHS